MTTPVLVQSAIFGQSGTSTSATFPGAVTPGNTIIAFGSAQSTATTMNFTDNVNTGRYARDQFTVAGSFSLLIGRFAATASGTPTVTMSSTASVNLTILIEEWSGFDALIPFEQGMGTNGSSTSPSAGTTATLAESGELVLAYARLLTSGQTWTAGSGFTLDPIVTGVRTHAAEYQVVSGTSPVAAGFTITGGAQSWTAISASYRSAKTRKQIAITTPGAGTFSAPADWPGIADKAEVIGGGAAGRTASGSTHEGLGGGGGAYTYINALALSNGDSYSVGAGGVTSSHAGAATWLKTTGTLFADFGTGAGVGTAGGGGLIVNCIPSANAFAGGAGGAFANSATAGATGGGGAAGPWGAGGIGGAQSATGTTGGTGGGGAEGAIGVNQSASNQAGTAGGNAGNFSGNQAGTGGAGGASGLNAGSPGTAATPNGGGAGGGGGGSDGAGGGGAGGNGAAGVDWLINAISYGAGGGGGGTGQQNSGSSPSAGNGGLYGGGGGGGGNGTATMFGTGAQGLIVLTYTPIQASATPIFYTRKYVLFNT